MLAVEDNWPHHPEKEEENFKKSGNNQKQPLAERIVCFPFVQTLPPTFDECHRGLMLRECPLGPAAAAATPDHHHVTCLSQLARLSSLFPLISLRPSSIYIYTHTHTTANRVFVRAL